MKHKTIHNLIDKFLEQRIKNTDCGWTNVQDKELEQLYSIIFKLIDAKWQRNCDNDPSVRAMLIDRTRYEAFHYQPVPYDHTLDENSEYSLEDILDKRLLNVNIATEELQRTSNVLRYLKAKNE